MLVNVVPFGYSVIEIINQLACYDSIILTPDRYFYKLFPKHKVISYSDIAYTPQTLGFTSPLSGKLKYNILSTVELFLVLQRIINNINPKPQVSLLDLKRALIEFYNHNIDIMVLKNNSSESILSTIIEKIEEYCFLRNLIPEVKLLANLVDTLNDSKFLPEQPNKFIAILPIEYNPNIWQLLNWVASNHTLELFIQSDLIDELPKLKEPAMSNKLYYLYKFFEKVPQKGLKIYHWSPYESQIIKRQEHYTSLSSQEQMDNTNNCLSGTSYNSDSNTLRFLTPSSLSTKTNLNTFNKVQEILCSTKQQDIKIFQSTIAEALYATRQVTSYLQQNPQAKIGIVSNNILLLKIINNDLSQKLRKNQALYAQTPTIQYNLSSALAEIQAGNLFWLIILYAIHQDRTSFLAILKHPLCISQKYPEEVWEFEKYFFHSESSNHSISNYFDETLTSDNIVAVSRSLNAFLNSKVTSLQAWCKAHWGCYNELLRQELIQDLSISQIEPYNAIEKVLQRLIEAELAQDTVIEITKQDYASIIQELLHLREPYLQGNMSPAQIEIISPIEARFQRFDYLIVCGLNEGYFPLLSQDHNLISPETRKIHTYPSPLLCEVGYSEHDFYALLASSTEISLTYSSLEEPTRWLQLFNYFNQPSIYEFSNTVSVDALEKHPLTISSPYIPMAARPKRLTPSAITKLLYNPYCYYIEYVLGLRQTRRIAEASEDGSNFGFLVNQALCKINEILNQNEAHSLQEQKEQYISTLIAYCINAEDHHFMLKPYLQKIWRYLITDIGEWVWYYKNEQYKTYTECSGEMVCKITSDYHVVIKTIIDSIKITQTVKQKDTLIQDDQENDVLTASVIHYKTGTPPSKNEIENGLSPQLAIESIILKKGRLSINDIDIRKIDDVNLTYLQLNGRKNNEKTLKIDLVKSYNNLERLLHTFYNQEERYVATYKYKDKEKVYRHLARN